VSREPTLRDLQLVCWELILTKSQIATEQQAGHLARWRRRAAPLAASTNLYGWLVASVEGAILRPAWVVLSVCAREGPDLLEHGEYRQRRRFGARAFATGALRTQPGTIWPFWLHTPSFSAWPTRNCSTSSSKRRPTTGRVSMASSLLTRIASVRAIKGKARRGPETARHRYRTASTRVPRVLLLRARKEMVGRG
jgi:hypothetical protein